MNLCLGSLVVVVVILAMVICGIWRGLGSANHSRRYVHTCSGVSWSIRNIALILHIGSSTHGFVMLVVVATTTTHACNTSSSSTSATSSSSHNLSTALLPATGSALLSSAASLSSVTLSKGPATTGMVSFSRSSGFHSIYFVYIFSFSTGSSPCSGRGNHVTGGRR